MKKFLIITLLLTFFIGASAQQPFKGFFKPVSPELTVKTRDVENPSVWLFRPAIEISALQLMYNKDLKQFDASSLTSAGLGISFAHFINNEGQPYSNYGFNLLCLFDTQINSVTETGISLAGTVSAFELISVGAGYNFGVKKFLLLTGITYNFN